jgi:succinyl-diaminopimelate desuccinylase
MREDAVLARIEGMRDEAITFLQEFTRIDTANPPGDTQEGAAFIAEFLTARGVEVRTVAPQPTMPNLIADTTFAAPGRHLILNGHIDVFPPGPRERWTRDPLSGDLDGGRIHGRGTADMKAGTAAMIFTYLALRETGADLAGRVTLTVVSDEETGGQWGTGWLMEHHRDEVLGDCLLNAEPSSPWTVRFGEKSPTWFRFRIRTPGAHGAYVHLSKSATRIAARLMLDLERLEEIVPEPPENVARLLSTPEAVAAIERALGSGAAEVVQRVTVNFGMLHGGIKLNIIPGDATVEADIRMPVGTTAQQMREAVAAIAAGYPEVTVEEMQHFTFDPTCSDPEHEMVGHIQDAAEGLIGFRPVPIVTLGGTDCRYWRMQGVPAYVYGVSPDGMGQPDESVSVDEYLHVLRTHVLAARRYLAAG